MALLDDSAMENLFRIISGDGYLFRSCCVMLLDFVPKLELRGPLAPKTSS